MKLLRKSDSAPAKKAFLRLLKGDAGSSLVEYALVFMVFMTMMLGIADFGRALYAYHFASGAARDATRYASVRGSTCSSDGSCVASNSASGIVGPTTQNDVTAFVKQTPLGIDPANVHVTANWPNGNTPGNVVSVQVEYDFSFAVPIVSKLINGGNPLQMKSTSEMVISH